MMEIDELITLAKAVRAEFAKLNEIMDRVLADGGYGDGITGMGDG